jgi:glycosyltransferase involved in cell wall biosynthesis
MEITQPKISVIIPVYNAGKYFEPCLESLVEQTLHEIEIIIVLDCPTDGSEKVAERFAAQDNRIKLIYNEQNLHCGLSRNRGLEVATGEYIGFVDADDSVDVIRFEKMYNIAKHEDADILCSNSIDIFENHEQRKITQNPNPYKRFLEYIKIIGGFSVFKHIFKQTYLKQNDIIFEDYRLMIGEDWLFCLKAYIHTSKFAYLPDYLYYRNVIPTSTGHTKTNITTKKIIKSIECAYSYLQPKPELYKNFAIMAANWSYAAIRSYSCLQERKQNMQLIASNKIISNAFNYLLTPTHLYSLLQVKPTSILFILTIKFMK